MKNTININSYISVVKEDYSVIVSKKKRHSQKEQKEDSELLKYFIKTYIQKETKKE